MEGDPLRTFLLKAFGYYAQRSLDRAAGLTDEEYFWEPVPYCWSVRPSAAGRSCDWSDPHPVPPPVTTIAWRLVHTIHCLREHWLRPVAFERGLASWTPPTVIPANAEDALDALRTAIDSWTRDLASIDDQRLWEALGQQAGSYASEPVVAFVEHIHDEFIHHTAEVALLRDLFRAGGAPRDSVTLRG